MHPWERRLKDLAQLLSNCGNTYFDPDLFRMNTNQFLQTSRTITFIIQKNKELITDFEEWYAEHVHKAWNGDSVMQWAKESRNLVEKEGDLDLNSTLTVTLIASYLEEEDLLVKVGRAELLDASVKKLVRFANRTLHTATADAAGLKIERRWVTASLPDFELLNALIYIYSRMVECCMNLAAHLNSPYPKDIPDAGQFDTVLERAKDARFIKLRSGKVVIHKQERVHLDKSYQPPEAIKKSLEELKSSMKQIVDLDSAVEVMQKMAQVTFSTFGNHIPMLFIFDKDWKVIGNLSPHLEDQSEKFFFWRWAANKARTMKASGIIWISEAWMRDIDKHRIVPVRAMPISGERLTVVGLDNKGRVQEVIWDIKREGERPALVRVDSHKSRTPFFLVPIMRAMGIENALERIKDLD